MWSSYCLNAKSRSKTYSQLEILLHERREVQPHNQTLLQELQSLRLKVEQDRVAQESYVRKVEDRVQRGRPHAVGGQGDVDPAQRGWSACRAIATAVGIDAKRAQPISAISSSTTRACRNSGATIDADA
jgi:hypothetical protein